MHVVRNPAEASGRDVIRFLLASNLSRDPFNRPAGTRLFSLMTPGTSCLATIMMSLRDKRHSTAEAFA